MINHAEKFAKSDASMLRTLRALAAMGRITMPVLRKHMQLTSDQMQDHLKRGMKENLIVVHRGAPGILNQYSAVVDFEHRFTVFQKSRDARFCFKKSRYGDAPTEEEQHPEVQNLLAQARAARPTVRTTWRMPEGAMA